MVRQEIISFPAKHVTIISKNINDTTIPMPYGMTMDQALEIKQVLLNSSWEVIGVADGAIYFRRYVEDTNAC